MDHSESLRIIAERYVSRAETTSDSAERRKCLAYAQAYTVLSEQVARQDSECEEPNPPT